MVWSWLAKLLLELFVVRYWWPWGSGKGVKLIVVDGGNGLLASLPLVYPQIMLQRYWAHKIRNVLNKAKKRDQKPMKLDLDRIMYVTNRTQARKAARRYADLTPLNESRF